jgi:hypothetical protein
MPTNDYDCPAHMRAENVMQQGPPFTWPAGCCPECGWGAEHADRGDWFHAPGCPVEKRWAAVRPATCPCCGEPTMVPVPTRFLHPAHVGQGRMMVGLQSCPGLADIRRTREDDKAWLADHPDVDERVRLTTTAEQLRYFLCAGIPVTHMRAFRWHSVDYVRMRRVEQEGILWSRY